MVDIAFSLLERPLQGLPQPRVLGAQVGDGVDEAGL